MNKLFVSSIVLLTAVTVFAAPKTKVAAPPEPEMSTREEALKENADLDQKAYKKTIQASEAQQANVESFLKLQDPAPELRNRPWLWSFAFKLQSFKPLGTGKVSTSSFALDNYGNAVMPSIDFGFLVNTVETDRVGWMTGLGVHAGYTSQKTNLVTPNFQFEDTRLNSGVFSAVWNNRIRPMAAPKWSALISPEYGVVNYTQTATNSSQANFNQQNTFWGAGVGLEYMVSKKWGVLGQYSYRKASAGKSDTTDLQTNNYEIGTSVVW